MSDDTEIRFIETWERLDAVRQKNTLVKRFRAAPLRELEVFLPEEWPLLNAQLEEEKEAEEAFLQARAEYEGPKIKRDDWFPR